MYVRCSVCEGVLTVAIFMTRSLRLEGKKPLYEIFIDKDKEDYLTWDMERKKWRTARIDFLNFPAYSRYSDIYITPEENKLVSDYLGVRNGVKGIEEYQRSILDKRLQEKHKKETAPWDAAMELVSDTPKDWNRWVNRHGLSEHFIFYDYSRNVKEGYCTWCEKEVPVKRAIMLMEPVHTAAIGFAIKRMAGPVGYTPKKSRFIFYSDMEMVLSSVSFPRGDIMRKGNTGHRI